MYIRNQEFLLVFTNVFTVLLCFSLMLIVAMARPIKLFQFTQKLYHSFGIYPTQSDENLSFNIKNGFVIFVLAQMSIFVGAFFVFQAKRLDEFGASFHISVTSIATLFYFITAMYQMENILKLIVKFEEFIGNSKCF